MENLNLTLTKVETFDLEPFGKFVIKWNPRQPWKPNVIPFNELSFNHETGMPLSEEQEKQLVKYMKKHKTDILSTSDGRVWYTRLNEQLVRVYHKKLLQFNMDEEFRIAVMDGKSF